MHYTLLVLADSMDEVEALMAPYQDNNMGDVPSKYLKFFDFTDEAWHDEYTGNGGSWENPDAEWDYCELGGRWSNRIATKGGERVDFCPVAEIDTSVPLGAAEQFFATHSVLTPDGVWHEITDDPGGEDHWRETFVETFIEPYQDKFAYLIDYHM